MITSDAIAFLRELAANNANPWFDENRKRYEKNVRDPFKELYVEIATRLHDEATMVPGLSAEQIDSIPRTPREGIMRINRDLAGEVR
ncbi:MAG: DUF2461 family protein [Spirochaetota bacterium]